MEQKDYLRRVGDAAQLFGIQDCRLLGGKADEMRVIRLYNAAGLALSVLPDRGMDLAQLSYAGQNISFLSNTGLVSPRYFQEDGAKGFFKNFFAGFLTTGGLTYMGAACVDEGEELGLHGVISNTPAEEVCPFVLEKGATTQLCVRGKVRQARVFGENMRLERKVTMDAWKNEFTIADVIENCGFLRTPLMLLYHMNFGYPLLSPALCLHLPSGSVAARDAAAQKGLQRHLQMEEPLDARAEEVFFHTMQPTEGRVEFMLENPEMGLGVCVSYPWEPLPNFTQWKCMRSGEYVLGLEPGNCDVCGRAEARRKGSLRFLEPGESVAIDLHVRILSTQQALEAARNRICNKSVERKE